jgi:ribonuclease E
MPNTARGGGISRKITDSMDRRRLKEVAQELEVPEGMGVILRTAGASRTKTEIKRDFEYLLRMWETVRDLTLKSQAPTLVYEEGSLVKRSIRDLYNKDIDEIQVAGEGAYQEAKDFMRMLMPSHARNVKPYNDTLPVFTRHGIESQLDAMFQPVVQLRSGGYIVLNQAEALVAIDVNSGRATREHHIEDTALKTNLEAAEEIARQLRLRDLAGLIVIDFIDMDEKRNNRSVERRLKECLRHDRARIQVGHISHFGLLEMSRQRLRTSVLESSTEKCPHCGGSGHVRSVASVALQLLRSLEEMLMKGATHNIVVRTRTDIALYLLNHKRAHLRSLEERFQIAIMVNADATITGQQSFVIDKAEQVHSVEQARAIALQSAARAEPVVEAEDEEYDEEFEEEAADRSVAAASDGPRDETQPDAEGGQDRKRRRRRRGRRGNGRHEGPREELADQASPDVDQRDEQPHHVAAEPPPGASEQRPRDENGRRRRRGRRGGRRNRRGRDGEPMPHGADTEMAVEPEVSRAVSDFDRPPPDMPEPFHPTHTPEPMHESAAQGRSEPEPQPMAAPEPPRRRSTVREPAPTAFSAESEAPYPQPVERPQPATSATDASEPAEEAGRPRRAGWWSRKALGKG